MNFLLKQKFEVKKVNKNRIQYHIQNNIYRD